MKVFELHIDVIAFVVLESSKFSFQISSNDFFYSLSFTLTMPDIVNETITIPGFLGFHELIVEFK